MEREIIPIVSEKDLEYYENRLNQMAVSDKMCKVSETTKQKSLLGHHLTVCKGKLVKVEICSGNCLQSKVGMLLDVGADYIVIKSSNAPVSTVVPINNIHCITFVHNNDKRQIMKP